MIKFTRKIKDYIAKSVITPLMLAVLIGASGHFWKTGDLWVFLAGVFMFLDMAFIAVLLLSEDDEEEQNGSSGD